MPMRETTRLFWVSLDIGKRPDREIAEQIGAAPTTVASARNRMGLPAPERPTKMRTIDWRALPLGQLYDHEIAKQIGVSKATVYRARVSLGIPGRHHRNDRVRGRIASIDWASLPLGQVSDEEIARRCGCSRPTVARERTARGIPAYQRAPSRDWTAVGLGTVADHVIAERLGVPVKTVMSARRRLGIRGARYIDWDSMPLGQRSDGDIAREYGVDRTGVSRARAARGIPPFDPTRRTK